MATYTPRLSEPSTSDLNWIHYTEGGYNYCIIGSNGGISVLPNCTGYAWGRWRELLGEYHNLSRGNAEKWFLNTSDGYARGQVPKLGAVICWSVGTIDDGTDGAGHVAIVEQINDDGSIVISQSGWGSPRFWTQTINKNYYYGSSYKFQGFIYLPIEYGDHDDVPTPISGNRFLTLSEMQVNATYIWWYLKNKGWSLNAVCGMLGNMQRESTINPGIWQDLDEGNMSMGYGLVQWTPASNYINWCNSNGLTPSHMDSNLKRIIYELENGLQYYSTDAYPESFKQFSVSTKSVEYLVTAFLKNYERAGVEALDERIENGNYWYSYLQNINFDDDPPHNPIYFKRKSGYKFVFFKKKGVIRK